MIIRAWVHNCGYSEPRPAVFSLVLTNSAFLAARSNVWAPNRESMRSQTQKVAEGERKHRKKEPRMAADSRFLSDPLIIRVPFFPLFSFNKGTITAKSAKGYYSRT